MIAPALILPLGHQLHAASSNFSARNARVAAFSQMICENQEQFNIRKSRIRLDEVDEIMVADRWVGFTSTPCHLVGRRYWFLCPGCERRCAILYPHLCRVCIKGRYRSETLNSHRRKIRKAIKWRGAVGQVKGGTIAPFPSKPKRMRWHTWMRLRAESMTLEQEIWAADFLKMFGRPA